MHASSYPLPNSAGQAPKSWPASILVLAHPSMSEGRALPQSLALAQASGARLRLRMIVDEHDLPPSSPALVPGPAREAYLRVRREWLERYRHQGQIDPSRIDVEVLWARHYLRSFRVLIEHTLPNLVLKDSQCNGAVLPHLLTPLDWQLLRASLCPILLTANVGPELPLRIAAAVDCSEYGDAALNRRVVNTAATLARACNAELRLVSVLAERQEPQAAERLALLPLPPDYDVLRLAAGVGRECCDQQSGQTVRELEAYVHAQCIDLVVAGATQRRSLARLVLGSTAEDLLVRLHCDVLLVPSGA